MSNSLLFIPVVGIGLVFPSFTQKLSAAPCYQTHSAPVSSSDCRCRVQRRAIHRSFLENCYLLRSWRELSLSKWNWIDIEPLDVVKYIFYFLPEAVVEWVLIIWVGINFLPKQHHDNWIMNAPLQVWAVSRLRRQLGEELPVQRVRCHISSHAEVFIFITI